LYRHFSDKQSLIAAVAREGFRTLRRDLLEAWEREGRGQAGFHAMGEAYLAFAVANPSHYRVMFGRFLESCVRDPELVQEAEGAFQALVEALVAQQREGLVRRDDPVMLARVVWSVVHGIAMLTIDGQLPPDDGARGVWNHYASQRLQAAVAIQWPRFEPDSCFRRLIGTFLSDAILREPVETPDLPTVSFNSLSLAGLRHAHHDTSPYVRPPVRPSGSGAANHQRHHSRHRHGYDRRQSPGRDRRGAPRGDEPGPHGGLRHRWPLHLPDAAAGHVSRVLHPPGLCHAC